MPALVSRAERQAVSALPFCYLCGIPFENGEARHADHVPPKAIFAKQDRDPLVLASHDPGQATHRLLVCGHAVQIAHRSIREVSAAAPSRTY
jgi:hypothetical protein